MKFYQIVVSTFLAFVCTLLIFAAPQQSPKSKQTAGTVRGVVGSAPQALAGPWMVVIEHKSKKQEIDTDAAGRFETQLAPGVYAAYVRPTSRKLDDAVQRVPFLVSPGGVTNVWLDPTSEYVYCTREGERVMPVRTTDTDKSNLKGLHRPAVDTFRLEPSDKESRKFTIEYCGKTKTNKLIKYRSAIIRSDQIGILADHVEFDPENYRLESEGRILLIRSNGTKGEVSRVSASLRGGVVISMEAKFRPGQ